MLVKLGAGLVGLIHVYFAVSEMFRWETISGRLLSYPAELAAATAVLGFNQGAYNGFFALGLFAVAFGLVSNGPARTLAVFCLASLAAAGAVGLATVQNLLFLVQMLPALAVLGLVLYRRDS